VRPDGDAPAALRAVAAHTVAGIPAGAPFVSALRARPGTIVLGDTAAAGARWTLRVEIPEVWDTVRVSAPPSEPVLSVKVMALAALMPDADYHEDFVVKLGGAEVLDENAPVADAGARDGSILLVTSRRRRPVR
jgi:putative intracellular protease/amidase